MTKKAFIERINSQLGPLGFSRRGALWNRRIDGIIEVIDIHVSKAGDAITLNTGVFREDIYRIVWEKELHGFVEETLCIIRARVGEIIENHDLWWPIDASQTSNEISSAIGHHVLPFLKKHHECDAMKLFLIEVSRKRKDTLAGLYLAALVYIEGDASAACNILKQVQEGARGDWRDRAQKLEESFGC